METLTLHEFVDRAGSQYKAAKLLSLNKDRMSRMYRSDRDLRVVVGEDNRPIKFYEAEKVFYTAE